MYPLFMMDGFTVFMAVACIVSLMVIAFLITIFVILCIRTVDPSITNEFPSVGVGTGYDTKSNMYTNIKLSNKYLKTK